MENDNPTISLIFLYIMEFEVLHMTTLLNIQHSIINQIEFYS